jgi:uncharacterized protein YdeI (BOF family)
MFKTLTIMIASILLLGFAAFAQAEEGTDATLDTSRTVFGYQQTLTTKPVALQQASPKSDAWMGHAGDVVGGGM